MRKLRQSKHKPSTDPNYCHKTKKRTTKKKWITCWNVNEALWAERENMALAWLITIFYEDAKLFKTTLVVSWHVSCFCSLEPLFMELSYMIFWTEDRFKLCKSVAGVYRTLVLTRSRPHRQATRRFLRRLHKFPFPILPAETHPLHRLPWRRRKINNPEIPLSLLHKVSLILCWTRQYSR